MDIILKYFPDLTDQQKVQFDALSGLYKDWNAKINVISRKDIEYLYEKHILHSLSIAKWISFVPGTKILDVGCGGGFPGIPLAIMFPEVEFHLVDSIRKKLMVVEEVSSGIGLNNIKTTHSRVEAVKSRYDFIVTRAVAKLSVLVNWTKKNIKDHHINPIPNGIICLKGGNLKEELKPVRKREYVEKVKISAYFEEPFFNEKYIIYVQG